MEIMTNQVNSVALENKSLTNKVLPVESEIVSEVPIKPSKVDSAAESSQSDNTKESLQSAVAHINEHMQKMERSLQFTIDEGSGKEVVTVLDTNTAEIIRQFPSEETLIIARQIAEQKDDVVNLFSSQA